MIYYEISWNKLHDSFFIWKQGKIVAKFSTQIKVVEYMNENISDSSKII